MKKIERFFKLSHILILIILLTTGCGNQGQMSSKNSSVKELDLSAISSEKAEKNLNLLFIHHSCGATLFADPGEKNGDYCLYSSHPNGGGLRSLLKQNNYNVHEATYGSKIGQDTDINHWNAKFRNNMDRILKTDLQDKTYADNSVNNIVIFKSCYPANNIKADGNPPGNPDSAEKTIANYKATYNSLLSFFELHPETLFVAITAPPLVKPKMNPIKEFLKKLISEGPEELGKRARLFNNWLKDVETGWLGNYDLKNVVVFDYYDILTGKGESNWTKYPTKNGLDPHPSSEGNSISAREFILFINKAVRYKGFL